MSQENVEIVRTLAEVYHGHEGVRTYWRNWLSAWSDLQFEIQDVVDAGDEVVLLIRNQRSNPEPAESAACPWERPSDRSRSARGGRARHVVDIRIGPAADHVVGTDQVERREVGVKDVGDLHSVTSKLNIIPLSWCSAM
jgi:SnoaL-like domain